jgi:uncharacterized membrane protein (UPF0182 family)
MRVPTMERRSFRLRAWIIGFVVVLVILLFSLRGLAGFYTDYLWFDSLGQGGTWSALLGAKVVPAVVFTAVFFVIMLASLLIADRLAPKVRPMGPASPEDELVNRYQQVAGRYQGRIRVVIAAFFALIAGIGVSSQWRNWVLFMHRVDFGVKDPQFHKDIGFYVFQLPFIQFILDWLFAGLVIVLLVTAVAHYLNGGIRFQSPLQRVTPQVKAHLSVIVAVMALVKTAQYYFSRFGLTLSGRGVVDGATYTDVKAQLPAFNLLIFISVVAAGLFLWNIFRRGWVLPVIAVGLWGFVSIVVGTIYPAAIQNFRVKPNELAQERPYIGRNIAATRAAFKLNNVSVNPFNYTSNLNPSVVDTNRGTIENARLWDPVVIRSTYQTLQGLQPYYSINNVDIDRYTINGQTSQVLVAARDLNSNSLPSQSWVNQHVVYTHGYGSIVSPSNQATSSGDPVFTLSNIPPTSTGIPLTNQGAQLYFGQNQSGYVIVNAKQDEFNYAQANNTNASTRYKGRDGVKLSNIIRKAAFALRFGDINPLISGQVTGSSKLLMVRDIQSRVQKLAPFLQFDSDPYPVVVNGRITWVLDAYTTSDQYPYSQTYNGEGGLSTSFNYVRNSVKATIDAYDGTVHFYVIDAKDPMVRSYREAFPDLFSDFSKMPAAMRDHLRYPENLFKLQSDVFSKYHVQNTGAFYSGTERWLLSPDPNSVLGATVTPTTNRGNQRAPEITATTPRQDPYYLYIRLPGDQRENFLILQPFVPVSQNNQQTRLASFMTAKSDPANYGQLQAFVMPQGGNVNGPVQVANNIQSDTALSQQFTLLSQGGSAVVKGNIQLIPVGSSIVYVQPIFVQQGSSQGYPQFRFVVLFTQGKNPVFADTVSNALVKLFGGAATAPTTPTTPTTPNPTPGTTNPTAQNLLNQAAQKFTDADTALRNGDLATYQSDIAQGESLVKQAQAILSGGSTATTTPFTSASAAAFSGLP